MTRAKQLKFVSWGLIFAFCAVCATGCGLLSPSKETVITELVKQANNDRSSVIGPESGFDDYRVYRQGETDEVVFEFRFKPGTDLEVVKANSAKFKSDIMAGMDKAELKPIFALGIKLTYLYLSGDGDEVFRQSLSSEDTPADE